MESVTDVERARRHGRIAYEWGRARRALLGFLPVFVLVGGVCLLGERPAWSLAFGTALFGVGVAMLWYGREPQRAVLPGIAAGLVPLVLVFCARHVGHGCMGASCTSICVQACALGGGLAGLAVAGVGSARKAGPGFWISASAVTILTGAMACDCLGVAGVVGLGLGYIGGMIPAGLARIFARGSR